MSEFSYSITYAGAPAGGRGSHPGYRTSALTRSGRSSLPHIGRFGTLFGLDYVELDGLPFGQACSYKLFSHRSYIIVPDDSSEEDVGRLDALARISGIGLILFDKKDKEPEFEIRVRASRHGPDMFYVNKYLKLIEDDLFA